MKKPKKPSSKEASPPLSAKPSELTETDLDQVSGGITFAEHDVRQVAGGTAFQITRDITVGKAKTADKAYTQMDGYIKQ